MTQNTQPPSEALEPSLALPLGLEVPGPAHLGVVSEFWDAIELRWTATELRSRGLPLVPLETERGRGLGCSFAYKGVRFSLMSYSEEGPHYFMLSVDVSSALVQGEAPEQLVTALLEALSVPKWVPCWRSKGLDPLFHLRADEKFARDVLGVNSLTLPLPMSVPVGSTPGRPTTSDLL